MFYRDFAKQAVVAATVLGVVASTGGATASASDATTIERQPPGDVRIPGADSRDAQRLEGTFGHVLVENTPPSYRGPEPPEALAQSLWWEWTSPENGEFVFDTHGSDFDTVLTIYAGADPATLTEIARNDDDGDVVTSSVNFDAEAGEIYHFRVDFTADEPGLVDLSWHQVEPPRAGRERLEGFAAAGFTEIPISINTGEKPQSKVWQHDGTWWAVLASTGVSPVGTWLWRLGEDNTWSNVLHLSAATNVRGDAKRDGDVVHILLHGPSSSLVSIEYVSEEVGYELWDERPTSTLVSLPGSETATIDIDSTGRMWLTADAPPQVHVYHSDPPYNSFSGPVNLVGNIATDDISVVTTLPGRVGVLWSNQTSRRFGFRLRTDGAAPGSWSPDEVPAGSSALPVGDGMADDHLNVAVASDGTFYAAIKTEYGSSNGPVIGLLKRNPDGTWDPLHEVDRTGTRPIVLLNEDDETVRVIYTEQNGSGEIWAKTSSMHDIDFGPRTVVIPGQYNNVTSTKENWSDQVPVLASTSGHARHAFIDEGPIGAAGLRGLWSMDDGGGSAVADGSGWGNDGVVRGSPSWVSGQAGLALQLDGSDDHVTVADDSSLDLSGAMTMAAWVRPDRATTQYVIKKAAIGGTDGFELALSSGSSRKVFVRFNQVSSKNTYRVDSSSMYPTDGQTWMHVAATYDGSTMRLFIDGELEASGPGPSSIAVNDLALALGAEPDGSRPFGGALDEVRVYDRALTSAEIAELADVPS